MTLHNPPDHESDGKRDKHFGMLRARWSALLGQDIIIYLNGGHRIQGVLKEDAKGYVLVNGLCVTYFELGDVVAVMQE